ncbi:MAG: hypothetical protein U0905_04555 [Pirellulales bacterium]
MDEILRQSVRARRRLMSQAFFRYLSPWLLITFSIAVVGVAIPKLWYISVATQLWTWGWVGGAFVLSLTAALVMSVWKRPSIPAAAAEIDRRFGLKERLGSVLHLTQEDTSTPIGEALMRDATTKAERIDVRDAFPIGIHRGLAWSLLPLGLAVASLMIADAMPGDVVLAKDQAKVEVNQVRNSTQPLFEKIKAKREQAEKLGDADAAELFKQLEDKLENLRKDEKLDSKQALAKLNEIKKEMEERRKELGSGESLKKNLQDNLKQIDAGPAEKMAKAMQEGDLQKAEDELQKMMDKMNSGEMSASEQQQLAKQLDSMQKALQDSVEKHDEAKKMVEEQLKQAEQSGDVQKAAQLRKQLEELNAMDDQMQQLSEMQSQLQELQEALKSGDSKAAQQAMEKMMAKLEQMQMDMDQLEDLDSMMDELTDSKNSMNCKNCNGKGCSQCKGKGMMNRPGNGLGQGTGVGDRPEEENDTNSFDSQVRDQMRAGETVMKGKVAGANKKGVTREEVKQSILTSTVEEAEALESVVLPKAQRDQSRDYFNRMREGNKTGK